jgi:hypothetical protein
VERCAERGTSRHLCWGGGRTRRGPLESFTCREGKATTAKRMSARGHPGGTGCDEGDKTGGGKEMRGNVGGWQMQGGKRETPGSLGQSSPGWQMDAV